MLFFFYGTLMADSRNAVARALHAKLRPLGPATVHGSLYAIPDPRGWYPALLHGKEVVHGALYEAAADFSAEDLARIDAYEDYDAASPETSLYTRSSLPVASPGGMIRSAQAYCFIQQLPQGATPIPDGDFAAWLAEHGLTAFGQA